MGKMSEARSTTQISCPARDVSAQISQTSSVERNPHRVQDFSAAAAVIVAASRSGCASLLSTIHSAIRSRCAARCQEAAATRAPAHERPRDSRPVSIASERAGKLRLLALGDLVATAAGFHAADVEVERRIGQAGEPGLGEFLGRAIPLAFAVVDDSAPEMIAARLALGRETVLG